MRIEWYWQTFRRLPVTFHLDPPRVFYWRGVYGVHIGGVFIGVVCSQDEP